MGICYYLSSKYLGLVHPYECRDSVNSASKTASLVFQPLFPSGTHSPAAAGAGAETQLPPSVTCERLWHVAIKGVLRSSQAAHSLDASSISASSFRGWCQTAAWRRVGRAMNSLGRCSSNEQLRKILLLLSAVAVSFWHFQDSQRKYNMVRGHQEGKRSLCPHRH